MIRASGKRLCGLFGEPLDAGPAGHRVSPQPRSCGQACGIGCMMPAVMALHLAAEAMLDEGCRAIGTFDAKAAGAAQGQRAQSRGG